ncbi:MAG TPA: prolyl oligopeptidase family serine peptidase [Chitinophagaceae bacterium]|nr:prolyl oligopeptidase family serine peptidase [Chitinophagaceae bacterium]
MPVKLFQLLMLFFMLTLNADAQDLTAYEKNVLVQGPDTLPYRLLLPLHFDASKKYPLVLFLHGAGERGRDNEAQLTHGGKLFLQDSLRAAFPAIVVFPQCAPQSFWSNVQFTTDTSGRWTFNFQEGGAPTRALAMVEALLEKLQGQYKLKEDQLYVMGLSMGGMGTFELVRRHPDLFAAAVPICGGAHPATAASLKRTDWWVFHGGKDDVVPLHYSEDMVAALKAQKASVKFTVYPEAGHNSWDSAFAEPQLLPWLFAQRK